jgi:hypothetical protein
MSALTFLNPAYLGALALVSIPILIHLIRKRRVRVVPWAAWEFLLESTRRNRRRLQVEQLILLLIRIAVIMLAVFAFSRPLFRSLGLPIAASDSRVHALIVLDNSYSMGHTRNNVSDFERARRIADDLLSRVLKEGDSVSLVLLSSKPEVVFKEPTFDLGRVRERVRSARLSDRGTDYGAGAALCAALLREVRAPTKEVYWITDSQRSGFPEAGQEKARAAWKELASLARIVWIHVAAAQRENLAVESPVFSRELVTPQAPVRIEAVVRNHSPQERKDLMVNLNVDGRAAGAARVNVPANGAAKASFVYLFEKAGPHTGTIQIALPDGLARDNTAFFAARVRDRLKTLVLNPRPNTDPTRDDAFYLVTALAPAGASQGVRAAIQPTLRQGGRLEGVDLRGYDALLVTGMADFSTSERAALEEFVRNGGGVLLFPGASTDPGRINAALGTGERFLPARLGAPRVLTEENALTLNPASISHPALNTFRDSEEVNLTSARFTRVFDLTTVAEDETTRVLVRFSDGKPALVERAFGQGKVVLSAFAAGTSGSSLPYKPAYVPLVHQLVAYLAAGPTAQRNLQIGELISTRFDVKEANRPVRLTDPSGQTSLQKTTLGAEGVVFSYAATERAGLYRIGLSGEDLAEAFAVNLPPGESDLASAQERQVRAAVGEVPVQFARGTDDLTTVVSRSRRGIEIWRALVYAALGLLFLEALLAQRFGRRG